jgi:peptidyl-prolyl cis-trans isomerase SurA
MKEAKLLISTARRNLAALIVALGICTSIAGTALAGEQKLIAIVNEQPVTSHDIDQQIQLNKLVGNPSTDRKKALNDIINQIVKVEEAKRFRMQPTDAELDARLADVAKGLKSSSEGLEGKLNAQGVGINAMRQYLAAQMSFARLLRFKYKDQVNVADADIDRKLAEMKGDLDSRVAKHMAGLKTVKVVSLIEVNFPVEQVETGMDQLLQSRAAEANQFLGKFKGCKSARNAASGIFNVKISKQFEADFSKLPKPLQAVLNKQGPGSGIGPMRSKNGIQVLAYCGQRTVTPQKPAVQMPTRSQVEQALLNEKFGAVENKYLAQMRRNSIIEYRDPSYAQ